MHARQTGYHLSADDQRRLDDLFDTITREQECFVGYPCNALFDYHSLFKFLDYPINNVGDPYVDQQFPSQHARLRARSARRLPRTDARRARRVLGLRHQRRHRGEHVRHLPRPRTVPRRHGLLHRGHALLGQQDPPLPARAQHHDQELPGRADRSGGPPRDDPHPPRRAADHLRQRRHDDERGDRRPGGHPGDPRRPGDPPGLHPRRRRAERHDPAVRRRSRSRGTSAPGIDSISISGHKMVGSPMPCGVVLAKKATSTGSRGASSTSARSTRRSSARATPSRRCSCGTRFRTVGVEGFRRRVRQCFETADYAIARLNEIGRNAWRHRNSVTVVFDRPSQEMVTGGSWPSSTTSPTSSPCPT